MILTLARLAVALALLAVGACTTAPKKSSVAGAASAVGATPATNASAASPAAMSAASADSGGNLPAEPSPFDLERADIRGFIDEVSVKHGVPQDELRTLLGAGMFQPRIIAAISRPAESVLRWWEYSNRLVSTERVARGI